MTMKSNVASVFFASVLVTWPALCLADKVYVTAGAGELTIDGKVAKIDGENLIVRVQGRDTTREIEKIQRLEIDGETAFNEAEKAFLLTRGDGTSDEEKRPNYEKAIDGYQKAMKSSNKEWLRDWAALRLVESASKTGRFDAAVSGWVALVSKDAQMAAKFKPALPEQPTTFLNTAATEVQTAASNPKLSDASRAQLLGFLLDLHRARKDDTAAAKVAEQLMKLGGDASSDPSAARAMGDVKLNLAKIALDRKDYDKALSEIDSGKALLIEPPQQADALYVIAEATSGKLGDNTDAASLRDAALAYMRVVAHFKDQPSVAPRVADSLLKSGLLLERSNDLAEASKLFEQVTLQFKDSPAAAKAGEALTRLKEKSAKKES